MTKQLNKIAITLSDDNKSLIQYLEAKGIKASSAINLAITSHYKNDIDKAKEYIEKLKKLNETLLSDTTKEVKKVDKTKEVDSVDATTVKEKIKPNYSKLDFGTLRIATQNEIDNHAGSIVWLTRINIKHYDSDFNYDNAIPKKEQTNALTGVKNSTVHYAFIDKDNATGDAN